MKLTSCDNSLHKGLDQVTWMYDSVGIEPDTVKSHECKQRQVRMHDDTRATMAILTPSRCPAVARRSLKRLLRKSGRRRGLPLAPTPVCFRTAPKIESAADFP